MTNISIQLLEISANGMVYTDEKGGDAEIFAQRKWKIITPLSLNYN